MPNDRENGRIPRDEDIVADSTSCEECRGILIMGTSVMVCQNCGLETEIRNFRSEIGTEGQHGPSRTNPNIGLYTATATINEAYSRALRRVLLSRPPPVAKNLIIIDHQLLAL